MHREVTDNIKGTNQEILKRLMEECPDDTTSSDMEEYVNDEDDYQKGKKAENKK